MSPAEINATLERVAALTTALANDTSHMAQITSGALAGLAVIVAEQEKRLRALEPCHERHGEPHLWVDVPEGLVCFGCKLPKP